MSNEPNQQILTEAEYTGWVYAHNQIADSDGYFSTVQNYKKALLLQLDQGVINSEDLPKDVIGCLACGLMKCAALEIALISVEDIYDNAIADINQESLETLQQALNVFYEANEHIQMHVPDWKIKILLDWGSDAEVIT